MQSAPPEQRLKRVPVWPLWGALVALMVASFGWIFCAVLVMTHVLGYRRTFLASVARVYSFKRIRSRRIRKLIATSPVVFALGWPFPTAVLPILLGDSERSGLGDGWGQWMGGVAVLFLLIHIFNHWRIRRSAKQLTSNAQTAP